MAESRTVDAGDDGIRLDRWFKRHFPGLSFVQLQKLLRSGQVRVDGKRARAGDRVAAGAALRIPPQVVAGTAVEGGGEDAPRAKASRAAPPVSERDAADLRARVLYRDDAILAIDKPAGLAVQGGSGTGRHLDGMLDALRFDADERPRLVHRLDRDTSGVLVLARSAAAAAALARAFRDRTTEKLYCAVVVGVPQPRDGIIELALAKGGGRDGRERARPDEQEGRDAVTAFRTLDAAGKVAALLELQPLTGRTHQLRAHCQAIGTPILGDGKYGGAKAFLPGLDSAKRLHLHARRLTLPRPGGGRVTVEAALPQHMLDTLAALGLAPT